MRGNSTDLASVVGDEKQQVKFQKNKIPLIVSLASYFPPMSCPWGRGEMGFVCTCGKHPSSQKIIGFLALVFSVVSPQKPADKKAEYTYSCILPTGMLVRTHAHTPYICG